MASHSPIWRASKAAAASARAGSCILAMRGDFVIRRPRPWLLLLAALFCPVLGSAQEETQDVGVDAAPTQQELDAEVDWHGTRLLWDHSVTAATLGLGQDYQTRNPSYEMAFRLVPRYYLAETPSRNVSVRGDVMLLREFTDSDVTTRRGEWTFTDAELWLAFGEVLNQRPSTRTELVWRAPWLRFPTSNASLSTGRVLGLGTGVGVDQQVPLAGADAPAFRTTLLRPRLLYMYDFSRATVPTSDAIDRIRVSPAGRSVPSDQLSGTAFAEHELLLSLRAETEIVSNFGFVTEIGMRYARRHELSATRVCGVVDTGCVEVGVSPDAPRWSVATLFGAELWYSLGTAVEFGLEYTNLTGQLGADGQRRSVFYSPDARIAVNVSFVLDQVYAHVAGRSTESATWSGSAQNEF